MALGPEAPQDRKFYVKRGGQRARGIYILICINNDSMRRIIDSDD